MTGNRIGRMSLARGVFFLSFALFACTKKNLGAPSATALSKAGAPLPVRIGFVLATMNEERYAKDRNYFLAAASRGAVNVDFGSCDDRVDVQHSKVEKVLAKKADVLVLQPVNGATAGPLVARAKETGVPVVAYDRPIRDADVDLFVTQDNFRVGVLQAEAATKATAGKGNYILLGGEAGNSVAEEITRGALSVLTKYPAVKVVVKENHPGWSTALAWLTVTNGLTRHRNDIQAVLASNDGMAMGATQALEEAGLVGRVFVAGADADLAAIRDIVNGRQAVTVLKRIQPLAEKALEAAVTLAHGKQPKSDGRVPNGHKDVPVIYTPVVLINKANVDEEIIATGFHSRDAVYGSRRAE